MAYAKAVLKMDPGPAFKLLADKIALRASAYGIQLKVETAPRFAVKAVTRHGRMAVVGERSRMVH